MIRFYDIVMALLMKELRVRYKHMALGYVWSVASPLAHAFLYFVVFGQILKVQTPNFPVFLICGLFPWQWVSNSLAIGPMIFYGNAQLIKKTNFPRYLIAFVQVLQDAIHFLVSVPVIVFFLVLFKMPLHLSWLYQIPLLCILQFGLTYAFMLFLGTMNLFLRDLERLLQLSMTAIFYFTPVIYSADMIPDQYRSYLVYQPFAMLIINWRNILMGSGLNWSFVFWTSVWVLVCVLISQVIYQRLQWRFAEVL